ncbi:MAG: CHRD domain-containing protein [Bryobacterales bacterium]|nr:CHRD domain-containing protein [Bryobacterales bacterium]
MRVKSKRGYLIPVFGLLVVLAVTVPAVGDPPAAKNFGAHLDGGQEVPARETPAQGQAIFHLNADETAISYQVIVANINNVVASHIHFAAAGTNGSVVAFLAGPFPPGGGPSNGILGQGTITAASLVGPLAGFSIADLAVLMRAGMIYVNVHTNDGVDPTNTGPGDFPGGEIRGQVRPLGPGN